MLFDVREARAYNRGEMSDPDRVGVRAAGPFTLEVQLDRPTGYLLQLLTHNTTYPVPQHVVESLGDAWLKPSNMVSNGPFRLLSWQPAESVVLERNPEYQGHFGGNVERVDLRLTADTAEALAAYEADALDALDLGKLPQSERDRARQRHAAQYVVLPQTGSASLIVNTSQAPLDDRRVRRALALSIDQETLSSVVGGGSATGGYLPPGIPGHSPRLALPYDPERARQLLAEAGYPARRSLPLIRAASPTTYRLAADYVQAQWQHDLSIESTFELLEWSDFIAGSPEEYHLILFSWQADYPDPHNFLRSDGHLRQALIGEWHTPLVDRARSLTDQGERIRLYREADRRLMEEAAIVPLVYLRQHWLVKPWVRRFPGPCKDVIIEPHERLT
jgi:oligopeptide transport system substrate-binding protein